MKLKNSMNGPYSIYHLDGERGFRGGERQLIYLAGYLRRQGHENIIVCRKGKALAEEAARLGHPVLSLPFLGEWDLISAARLRKASDRARFAPIFHAHTGHAAALAALASRVGGPPWIAHRRVDFSLSGRLSARIKYRSAAMILPVSRAIGDILAGQGIHPERMRVVPDCIPLGREESDMAGLNIPFAPPTPDQAAQAREALAARWKVPPQSPWIGNIAALVPHKDQATLLKAFRILLSEAPEARLFIIGSGPLKRELEKLSLDLGIQESVRFTGQQPNPVEWLHALDLFVLSSWGEGMGSVLLEAMACGRPIAATNAGGIPEIIEDGTSGLLTPPRSPSILAQAMLRALRDEPLRRRLAEGALRRVEEFSLKRSGRRVEECYGAITGAPIES